VKKDIILHGEVYACLDYLEDESISVAITSPPYWKQRDYKFENQIGQEKTPEEYIGRLVKVYDKLRQKLKDTGIFFLNIGDKYLNQYGKSHLLQIPYRLAYHMTKRGWILEDIIIWYKPNHMPSSVKDRFANTYEPILVFVKSEDNIYVSKCPRVVEIPLQQTPWKHTAVYPEGLVEEMLRRVELEDGDIILDPFAGTGTTAVVVNRMRNSLYAPEIFSVMIEKGDEFVQIIKKRVSILVVIEIDDVDYSWLPVEESDIPENIEPVIIAEDRYGEVIVAQTPAEFLSVLKEITLEHFKKFRREDALYFLGLKKWNLESLVHSIYRYGYVLRNMLIVRCQNDWYPVFMFARDSTKVSYRFYLDRVRVKPKNLDKRKWETGQFVGMKVKDLSSKVPRDGYIVKVLSQYPDGFPKLVIVYWATGYSVDFVIHPNRDEVIREGIRFFCPYCRAELVDPYDPLGDNLCPKCGRQIWENLDSVPIVQEPYEVSNLTDQIDLSDLGNYDVGQIYKSNQKRVSSSKFSGLDRINWGASPGARKLMLGEYFTKMRLYRLDQPLVAHYLTLIRKSKNMTIQEVISKFPKKYHHTVGHWFRKDFGGSIPLPSDVELLEKVLQVKTDLLDILKKTALKFQTVKSSIKGKNPGDYIKDKNELELITYFKSLYLPSTEYLKIILNFAKYTGDNLVKA